MDPTVATTATSAAINQTKKYVALVHKALEERGSRDLDPLTEQDVHDRRSDRGLKKLYACCFIVILVLQLLFMNVIFCLAGAGVLTFDANSLRIFMAGTLAEVFGVVFVITKNLFPKK